MKRPYLSYTILAVILSGCSSNDTGSKDNVNVLGSDKDKNGCIGSAGYSWCMRSNQCERPWELAKKEGFENTQEGFKAYCEL